MKWWFLIKKRTYIGKNVPTGKVVSDTEICKACHDRANLLILGKWSLRHRLNYAIMKVTKFVHDPK